MCIYSYLLQVLGLLPQSENSIAVNNINNNDSILCRSNLKSHEDTRWMKINLEGRNQTLKIIVKYTVTKCTFSKLIF